jgi:hypothetical protein
MVTIKINERTKAGKAILEIAEIFSKDKKGVEIIRKPSKKVETLENIPNETTLRSIEKTSKGIGLTRCDSIDDLFEKLGL